MGAVQILVAVWRLVVDYCCLHVPLLLPALLLMLMLLLMLLLLQQQLIL